MNQPGVCAVFLANETRFPGGAGFHFVLQGVGERTRNFSSLSGRAWSVIKETRASPSILKLRNNFLSPSAWKTNEEENQTGIPFPVSSDRRRVQRPF